jgi:glutamate dehydrogenase
MAQLPMLGHAPDIVMIATGAKSVIADVAKTYFAVEAFFRLDSIAGAVKDIAVGDYFDRLALDRALDTIGDAERRITTAMVGNGAAGGAAVEKWAGERGADVERIKAAIQEIAASGLTISKLTVAASMLGDLARR